LIDESELRAHDIDLATFQGLDKDGDGHISLEEWLLCLKNAGKKDVSWIQKLHEGAAPTSGKKSDFIDLDGDGIDDRFQQKSCSYGRNGNKTRASSVKKPEKISKEMNKAMETFKQISGADGILEKKELLTYSETKTNTKLNPKINLNPNLNPIRKELVKAYGGDPSLFEKLDRDGDGIFSLEECMECPTLTITRTLGNISLEEWMECLASQELAGLIQAATVSQGVSKDLKPGTKVWPEAYRTQC